MKYNDFKVLSSDDVVMHFRSWEGEGAPKAAICLVHGLGEHTGRYEHLARKFTEAGYALLGMDLHGHGSSAGARGHSPSIDASMDDIVLLVKKAEELYPAIPRFLYGHSMGGTLALNFLLRRETNFSGAVVTAPSLVPVFPIPRWKVLLSQILRKLVPSLLIPTGLDADFVSRDPAVVARYKADSLVHAKISVTAALDLLAMGEWALANAQRLKTPLLLMHGSADRLTSPLASQEFAKKAGKICQFREWQGLWHEIHNDPEWEEVVQFTIDWFDTRLASQ